METHQLRFIHFIHQRELSRVAYETIGEKGLCDDQLIQQYRFCNVNREHDAVTAWVRLEVRNHLQNASLRLALLNMAVARVFNEPLTLRNLLPVLRLEDWPIKLRMIDALLEADEKMFRGAYLMVSHGDAGKGIPVAKYYGGALTDVCMTDFNQCESMEHLAHELDGIMGFSDFLVNQVLTDLRYMPQTEGFKDRMTFVLCGPGTRRGINRWHGMTGDDADKSVPAARGTAFILNLREDLDFLAHLSPELINHFQDPNNLSNCFCEWDKYERALETIASGKKPHLKRI